MYIISLNIPVVATCLISILFLFRINRQLRFATPTPLGNPRQRRTGHTRPHCGAVAPHSQHHQHGHPQNQGHHHDPQHHENHHRGINERRERPQQPRLAGPPKPTTVESTVATMRLRSRLQDLEDVLNLYGKFEPRECNGYSNEFRFCIQRCGSGEGGLGTTFPFRFSDFHAEVLRMVFLVCSHNNQLFLILQKAFAFPKHNLYTTSSKSISAMQNLSSSMPAPEMPNHGFQSSIYDHPPTWCPFRGHLPSIWISVEAEKRGGMRQRSQAGRLLEGLLWLRWLLRHIYKRTR